MSEPVKLAEVVERINPENRSSDNRCENCGYGLRYRNRKWCGRCIEIYNRRRALSESGAKQQILTMVGLRYMDADMLHLPEEIREKLSGLSTGQDVFFFGSVGTGKTYTMAALIKLYVYEGYECKRINFDDFCVDVRSTMSPASKITERDMVEPLKQADKLFIDDLGLRSKMETDFAYVTFFSILNKRQERMLPTFISSNKTIEQLGESFDERIVSRLRTAMCIEIKGEDRRKQKQGE